MGGYLLPAHDERFKETLAMVFGSEPEVEDAVLDAANVSHVAFYVDGQGNSVAACYCDMGAASAVSSALSLIPPGLAEEMLGEGALTDMAAENLYEVMNIFSSLFMNDETDHLKLSRVERVESGLPTEVSSMVAATYLINSGKYPSGHIAFATKSG